MRYVNFFEFLAEKMWHISVLCNPVPLDGLGIDLGKNDGGNWLINQSSTCTVSISQNVQKRKKRQEIHSKDQTKRILVDRSKMIRTKVSNTPKQNGNSTRRKTQEASG